MLLQSTTDSLREEGTESYIYIYKTKMEPVLNICSKSLLDTLSPHIFQALKNKLMMMSTGKNGVLPASVANLAIYCLARVKSILTAGNFCLFCAASSKEVVYVNCLCIHNVILEEQKIWVTVLLLISVWCIIAHIV